MEGSPVDEGAREYHRDNKLPKYKDLTMERAKVQELGNKILISLPIKFDSQTPIEADNISLAFTSLLDVVNELDLPTLSIAKTEKLKEIPWKFVTNELKRIFCDKEITFIICKSLVRIPKESEREALILENHASAVEGHKGVNKIYHRLRHNYFWSNMKKDIQDFINNCRNCQLKKLIRVKTKQPMVLTDTPGSAFDKISMDIMGPLPRSKNQNEYILTMQDLLTKYSIAVPLKRATNLSIADAFLKNFICRFGAPKSLLTDQGSNFLSQCMKYLAKKFNIKQYKMTSYHPQSNGSIERSHHVLAEYLKLHVETSRDWDSWLELAMFSYNTSVHEGTRYTPHELVFGKLARQPASDPPLEENIDLTYLEYLINLFCNIRNIQDLAQGNLINSKEKYKRYYDKRSNAKTFNAGDSIFLLKELKGGKFGNQYEGPYEILEVLRDNNVKLKLPNNKTKIVHADKIRLIRMK